MNVVDAFLFHARQDPAAPAICAPGTHFNVVSYGRLERFINNACRKLTSSGLRKGHVIAVAVKDQILHATLVLALMRLGIISVSTRTARLPSTCRTDATLTDATLPEASLGFENAGQVIRLDPSWAEGDGAPPEESVVGCGSIQDVCCYALTAGTTGGAKAVALKHNDILRRVARHGIVWGSKLPNCARLFSDLDIGTLLGLLLMIHALSRGGMLFLRGTDAGETIQALGLYKVQAMVTAPGGLAEFLSYYESTPALVCPLECIVAVGSLLSGALAERARARMCTHMISSYGSTETHIAASAPSHQIVHLGGAVGYVTPGTTIEIVDASDDAVAQGREGVVRIRSEFGVSGYLGDPTLSAQHFRQGWFYPGDIGSQTAEGLLVISSREHSVINLGGDKVHAETIESVLLSCPGVLHAAAFGKPNVLGIESVQAAVVVSAPMSHETIRGACARRLAPHHMPERILIVPEIPRNAMGKVDRARLIELAVEA